MGVANKVWDALVTAIKMNDKVMSLAGTIKDQQVKIGGLDRAGDSPGSDAGASDARGDNKKLSRS